MAPLLILGCIGLWLQEAYGQTRNLMPPPTRRGVPPSPYDDFDLMPPPTRRGVPPSPYDDFDLIPPPTRRGVPAAPYDDFDLVPLAADSYFLSDYELPIEPLTPGLDLGRRRGNRRLNPPGRRAMDFDYVVSPPRRAMDLDYVIPLPEDIDYGFSDIDLPVEHLSSGLDLGRRRGNRREPPHPGRRSMQYDIDPYPPARRKMQYAVDPHAARRKMQYALDPHAARRKLQYDYSPLPQRKVGAMDYDYMGDYDVIPNPLPANMDDFFAKNPQYRPRPLPAKREDMFPEFNAGKRKEAIEPVAWPPIPVPLPWICPKGMIQPIIPGPASGCFPRYVTPESADPSQSNNETPQTRKGVEEPKSRKE